MKVSIFGLGYVGCVTAACLAKGKHEVIGVDIMASKVERLAAGHPTVVETGIEEMIAEAHAQGRITATTDGRAAVLASQASIICVGTPTGRHGDMDLTALRQTAELIGQAMCDKADRHGAGGAGRGVGAVRDHHLKLYSQYGDGRMKFYGATFCAGAGTL